MSSLFGPFNKLLLNKDIEDRIMIKIKDIQNCSKWHNFDLAIDKEKLDFSVINKDKILQEMNILEDVAKLSVDLLRDYDYYRKFIFENKYDSEDYRKRLENLGCECKDGMWKCVNKPSEDTVQLNVFMFCLYRLMVNEISPNNCIYCDYIIDHDDDKCNGCGATIEEIRLQKTNIENKSKKESVDRDQINVNDTEAEHTLNYGAIINDNNNGIKDGEAVIMSDLREPTQTQESIVVIDSSVNELKSGEMENVVCSKLYSGAAINNNVKYISQCIYCDLEIPLGADQCPGCYEFVSEIRIELAKKEASKNMLYDMKDVDPLNERKPDSLESVDKVDGTWGHNNEVIDKYESDGDGISTKNMKEGKVDAKWKCGGCECLNEYTQSNCWVCVKLYKEGKWSCGECIFENSCANDYCEICAARNTNVNVAVNVGIEGAVKNELFGDGRVCDKCGSRVDGREKLCGKCVADNIDRKDQWRCGKCGLMHAYSVDICNGCDASRIGRGKWTCDKCTMVNNCTDVKCTVCDTPNDYLSAKYCEKCNTNKVPSNKRYCDGCEGCDYKWGPNKWFCQYPKCKEYNDCKDRYCRVCRLQRDYSRARGENVKLWYKDEETIMWICHKCNKINKSSEVVCIDCGETRYKKRYCKMCVLYNDGTTNNCDKCYQQL